MLNHINGKLTRVPYGLLAKEILGLTLELRVLKSAAGWYLGTFNDGGPVSRESEYFQTKFLAESALKNRTWSQREHS